MTRTLQSIAAAVATAVVAWTCLAWQRHDSIAEDTAAAEDFSSLLQVIEGPMLVKHSDRKARAAAAHKVEVVVGSKPVSGEAIPEERWRGWREEARAFGHRAGLQALADAKNATAPILDVVKE